MPVEIQLFQRSETGPSRGGTAKPGLDLIDTSGADIGEATARFAGLIFDKLVATKAANEEATFQGGVKTAMAKYDVFVAGNPGASFEKLEKERNKMMDDIKKSGQLATTKIAKENNKNWFARNESSIFEQTQASMEAIRSKQEFATFQAQRKNMTINFDRAGLAELTTDMVESGLLNEDFAAEQLKNDFAVIDAAEQELAVGNAVQTGFDAWQATVTPEDPDGDLNVGFKALDELPIPDGERGKAENDLESRVTNRRVANKDQNDEAVLAEENAIQKRINENDTEGLSVAINSSKVLSEIQKASWLDAVDKDAKAKLADDEQNSPFNQGSDAVFQKWLNAAQTDPVSFNMNEMTELTKKSKTEGITTAQWQTINSTRNSALDNIDTGQDPLKSRTAVLGDEYLGTFKADDPEGWLESVNDYNKWYLDFTEKNKREPTPRESETKLQFLTTDIVREFWVNDLPDTQVKTELRDIPLEGQKEFVSSAKAKQSTTEFLREWRAKPKKLTKDIAVHYLGVTNGNRGRAIELAKRDGYTE